MRGKGRRVRMRRCEGVEMREVTIYCEGWVCERVAMYEARGGAGRDEGCWVRVGG